MAYQSDVEVDPSVDQRLLISAKLPNAPVDSLIKWNRVQHSRKQKVVGSLYDL
jgi:hypothetical protein